MEIKYAVRTISPSPITVRVICKSLSMDFSLR